MVGRTSSRGQSGPVLVSIYPYPAYGAAVPVGSGPGGRRGAIGAESMAKHTWGGKGLNTRRHTSARSHSSSLAPCRHAAIRAPAAAAWQLRSLDAATLPSAESWICFRIRIDSLRSVGHQMRRLRTPAHGTRPRPPSVSADRDLQKLVDPGVSTPGIPGQRSAVMTDVAECNAPGGGAVCGHVRPISEPSTTRRRLKRSFR